MSVPVHGRIMADLDHASSSSPEASLLEGRITSFRSVVIGYSTGDDPPRNSLLLVLSITRGKEIENDVHNLVRRYLRCPRKLHDIKSHVCGSEKEEYRFSREPRMVLSSYHVCWVMYLEKLYDEVDN